MQFNFNLSLVPIGNSYWVTATKIGSNYIKPFANPNDRYLRLTIGNIIEEHQIEPNQIYVTFPNGLKLKITVCDFDNIDYTHLYDEKTLLDIFSRVSVVLIRNPKERFKSGLVQKVSELYSEIFQAIENNSLNGVRFHDNVYFDLTKYDIDYTLLTTGMGVRPKDTNPLWQSEWDKFCNYLLNDIFNHPNIDRILLEDRHTQGVYHLFYLILNGLPNWNTIKTLDINDLDSCSELMIDELGKDEYEIRYDSLHNRSDLNVSFDGIEYTNIIKRVSNKRLYFNSNSIESYFLRAPFYVLERMYYDILSKKQYKKLL